MNSRMMQVEKQGLIEELCSKTVRTAALSLLRHEKNCFKWWRGEAGVPGYFRDLSTGVIEACRGAVPFSLHHRNASVYNVSLSYRIFINMWCWVATFIWIQPLHCQLDFEGCMGLRADRKLQRSQSACAANHQVTVTWYSYTKHKSQAARKTSFTIS